ncbi:MAG: hypothetical protein SGARI_008351 [Bacillariaceae sp.]
MMNARNKKTFSPARTVVGQYRASQLDTEDVTDDLVDLLKSVQIHDENDPNVETEVIDWVKERDLMDHYFGNAAQRQLEKAGKYKKPAGFKASTKLLPYQKDGVRWLVCQELSPQDNPFCSERKTGENKTIWMDRFTTRRKLLDGPYPKAKGSVLADGA